jgi:hypothetical protein
MGDGNSEINKDEYTVTETTILGVTETGVIRKRSVKVSVLKSQVHVLEFSFTSLVFKVNLPADSTWSGLWS